MIRYNDVFEQMTTQLKRNVSQVEVARALKMGTPALNNRKKKNSKFPDAELEQLEKLFGVKFKEPEQIEDGRKKLKDIIDEISAEKRQKITREKIGEVFGVSRQRITAMLDKPLPPHRLKQLEDVFCMSINETVDKFGVDAFSETAKATSQDDFIETPIRGDVSASCGSGVFVYNENQTAVYPISKSLYRTLGASVHQTEIIFATGDSMIPEIKDGDALMVDMSKREVIDGQIYIIRYDGQLMCKRLQKIPPCSVKVVSDNPKYDAYYIVFSEDNQIDFEVIGRVLWYSRIAR